MVEFGGGFPWGSSVWSEGPWVGCVWVVVCGCVVVGCGGLWWWPSVVVRRSLVGGVLLGVWVGGCVVVWVVGLVAGWFVVETGDMKRDVCGWNVLGSSAGVQTPRVARSVVDGPVVPVGPSVVGAGGVGGSVAGVLEVWQLVCLVTSGGRSGQSRCVSYVREDDGLCVQAESFVDDRGEVGFRVRKGFVEQATSSPGLGDGGGVVVEAGFESFAGAVRQLGVVIVGVADGEVSWKGSRPGEIVREVESRGVSGGVVVES